MKSKCVALIATIVLGTVMFAGCATSTPVIIPEDNKEPFIVRLPQATIDEAVLSCQDSEMWGIALAEIKINYMTGATIVAALVLHNGDDSERLVRLSYQPVNLSVTSSKTGDVYSPSPIQASGWVSVDTELINLDEMQTEVVEIRLTVPEEVKNLPAKWLFYVQAEGYAIQRCLQRIEVTTEGNDTVATVLLNRPLLLSEVDYIDDIESPIDGGGIHVISYNPNDQSLIIGGLQESSTREITVYYQSPAMVVTNYNQVWLISMLN